MPNFSRLNHLCLPQFHYSLGMSLYSSAEGNVVDDIIFSIADQIKHGLGNLADENPELRIDIAKLYELSGTKAVACSDHAASILYLTYALSLLPTDHWKSHYDLSLRFSLRLAKSCYSCGDVEKAQCILQEMTGQCHSFEDLLPANSMLAQSKYNIRCRLLRNSSASWVSAKNSHFFCRQRSYI
jgi:predicted ATPase